MKLDEDDFKPDVQGKYELRKRLTYKEMKEIIKAVNLEDLKNYGKENE